MKLLVDQILNHNSDDLEELPTPSPLDMAHLHFLEMSAYENELFAYGKKVVAGIDEAGRGPLAGPVVAAAVILPQHFYLPELNDSKRLTKKKRKEQFEYIVETCDYGIGFGTVEEIDRLNILEATKLAMIRALEHLKTPPDHVLIDALSLPIAIPQTAIVKGDAVSKSIAAASIVAKVTRDRYMEQLHEVYPMYGFNQHYGYGTKAHLDAIARFGITPEHRKSFEPIRTAFHLNHTLFDFLD